MAAKKLGKNYIAIDSNEKYVAIAKKRLEELKDNNTKSTFTRQNGKNKIILKNKHNLRK